MKKFNFIIGLILIMSLLLVGCGSNKMEEASDENTEAVSGDSEEKETASEDVTEVPEVEGKRIVAGTVAATELLDALEVDLVGVPTSSKALPERYKDLPRIGNPMKPDLEAVVSVEPDIYISDANVKETIEEMFKGQGIELIFLTNNSYEDVFKNIEMLGEALGKTEKANELIKEMRDREAEILTKVKDDKPEVLIIFGTPESFMIATQYSYTGSLVEKLGGVNIASSLAQSPAPYIPFSLETVAELNPDIILRLTHANPEESKKAFDAEFSKGFWVNLDAVKSGNVYDLDPTYFGVTANMQVMKALEEMAKILYEKE